MYKNWKQYLVRLFIITSFHWLFKQGDSSFSGAFEPSFRSLLFSIYFIVYWMLFWEACNVIYTKLVENSAGRKGWNHRFRLVTIILLAFVIIATSIFNIGYYIIDHYIFGISPDTTDISYLNPELFEPSDIFLTFKMNPELFFGFILFFLIVFGAHVFITSVKITKELELTTEKQKKESITAQYEALKNQIDPHFFFNSLSVLSSLIYESTELSVNYISHLSRHYRYILETPADRLVTVEKELERLSSYYYLIQLRYPDLTTLILNISDQTRLKCKILPHSLLMLVENAVKHNVFTKDNPLDITINEDNEYLIIRNNKNNRNLKINSTGIGLDNICKRYAIESPIDVIIESDSNAFVVKIPKL